MLSATEPQLERAELASLAGRRVVITGASTGVGAALARELAARGAEVVLACRSLERAEPVRAAIAASGHQASVVPLDLADLRSVRAAAARLSREPIDALVNNAGVGGARGVTRDGFELAFGTNHLGHYLLTRLLVPFLEGGRVVHLGSGSHASVSTLDFGAVAAPTRSLTGIREYAASKLAVMLFHHELDRRLRRSGSRTVSVVADPGNVASEAYRHLPAPVRQLWMWGMKSPAQGAAAPLHCVTAADLTPGACYVEGGVFAPSALSRDPALGEALWERSARWTGVRPDGASA